MTDDPQVSVTPADAAPAITPDGAAVVPPPADPVDAEAGWRVPPGADASVDTDTARLIVKRNGAETDVIFPVTGSATIGRFDPAQGPIDVDLASLPEGSYVSRKHARLERRDGVWYLTDNNSSNGTFILRDDFERVQETELKDGDEFALGNARFVFRSG